MIGRLHGTRLRGRPRTTWLKDLATHAYINYHRRHLRQFIVVHWPNRISNVALYHRCQSRSISESIITARWRLFGHVLRLPRDAPAQRAIDHYFADTEAATFRGRPRTSLPTSLCSPATHWSHTTPACRHRSSPRT